MSTNLKTVNSKLVRLMKGDITNITIDAFVFYARSDLVLGAGFGTAINIRGGPSVRNELKSRGPLKTTEAIATEAGDMKAKYIIHAAGPKFQEEDCDVKLKQTIINALKCADAKGVRSIALPPMGAGFYGVPLGTSAEITVHTVKEYLETDNGIEEIVICAMDSREETALKEQIDKLSLTAKRI